MTWVYGLIPVALVVGWYLGRYVHRKHAQPLSLRMPNEYFRGLNYIINEEQDKAIALFAQMLENNPELVETHLALGALFRRRGETARAIAIHENLVSQQHVSGELHTDALLELGRDYMSAGLLDRAETLFTRLREIEKYRYPALKKLTEIYDKEQDWDKAIETAEQLWQLRPDENWHHVLANYHCEKAILAKPDDKAAIALLTTALDYDPRCVRASILWAELLTNRQEYAQALEKYQGVERQHPGFMRVVLPGMLSVFEQVAGTDEIIAYLQEVMRDHPSASVMIALVEQIARRDGIKAAEYFLIETLKDHPTIVGLEFLVNMYFQRLSAGRDKARVGALRELLTKLREEKPTFTCSHCGFQARRIHWHCPGCRSWGTIAPTVGVFGE
jgi:lipopolysaccharide assembly protein B